jgi:hypothetical protein
MGPSPHRCIHRAGNASNEETAMSSRGKKKTTMAKLNREARLRERRSEKQARKEARRFAADTEPDRDPAEIEDGTGLLEDDTELVVDHTGLPQRG